jgi:hypothetical protein
MRAKVILAASLCAALVTAGSASAQLAGKRSARDSVEQQLSTAPKLIGGQLNVYQTYIAPLPGGGTASHKLKVKAPGFQLVGVCDDACGDLAIRVKDKDGKLIAKPLVHDLFPIIYIDVEDDTELLLEIDVAQCQLETCLYGLRAFHKPEKPTN